MSDVSPIDATLTGIIGQLASRACVPTVKLVNLYAKPHWRTRFVGFRAIMQAGKTRRRRC